MKNQHKFLTLWTSKQWLVPFRILYVAHVIHYTCPVQCFGILLRRYTYSCNAVCDVRIANVLYLTYIGESDFKFNYIQWKFNSSYSSIMNSKREKCRRGNGYMAVSHSIVQFSVHGNTATHRQRSRFHEQNCDEFIVRRLYMRSVCSKWVGSNKELVRMVRKLFVYIGKWSLWWKRPHWNGCMWSWNEYPCTWNLAYWIL